MGSAAGEYLRARDALLRVREYPEGASLACGLADALGDLKAFGSMIALTREAEQLVEFKAHEFTERLHPRDWHGRWAHKPGGGGRARDRLPTPGTTHEPEWRKLRQEIAGDVAYLAPRDLEFIASDKLGDCVSVSNEITQHLSDLGVTTDDGFWGPHGTEDDHVWNRLPDGSILDATIGQFDQPQKVMIARPGTPEYDRYVPWQFMSPQEAEEAHRPVPTEQDRASFRWPPPSWAASERMLREKWPQLDRDGEWRDESPRPKPLPADLPSAWPQQGLDWQRRWDAFPDDAYVWLFHETERGYADRFLREGVDPSTKPMTIPRQRFEAGEPATFSPGHGFGAGLTIAKDPWQASGYGHVLLAVRVRKGDVVVSPEQTLLGETSPGGALRVGDAMTLAHIPPEDIVEVDPGGIDYIAEQLRAPDAPAPDKPAWQWTDAEQERVYGFHFRSYGDAVPGGYNGGYIAIDKNGNQLGRLEYQSGGGEADVAWVEVPAEHQRQGVATKLYDWAQRNMPDQKWSLGFTTDEGSQWARSLAGHDHARDRLPGQVGPAGIRSVPPVPGPSTGIRLDMSPNTPLEASDTLTHQQFGQTPGTGHFGTGVYFVSDEAAARRGSFRPEGHPRGVDLTGAKLFKPADERAAFKLHDTLLEVDDLAAHHKFQATVNPSGLPSGTRHVTAESLARQLADLGATPHNQTIAQTAEEVRAAIEATIADLKAKRLDGETAGTRLMRAFGWDGVDTRHLDERVNNTEFGSVIYTKPAEAKEYIERLHPRGRHGRWTHKPGGVSGGTAPGQLAFDPATGAVTGQMTWEQAVQLVKDAKQAGFMGAPGMSSHLNDPVVHEAMSTTDHPRFFYHVTRAANADSIDRAGLEAGRSAGGRRRRVYLAVSPRADVAKRDVQYRVDTEGLLLRPDPEVPDEWAIADGSIPADRLTRHVGGAAEPATGGRASEDLRLRLLSNATAQREGTTPSLASNQTGIPKDEAEKGLIELEKAGLLRRETREFAMGGKHTYDVYVPTDAAKGKAIDHTRREPYDLPQSFKDEGYADGEQLTFPTGAQVGVASDKDGALKVFDLTYFDPEIDGPEDVVKDPEEWLYEIDPTDYLTEQDFSKDFWAGVPDRGETYYHGTTADNLSGIQDTGLEPRSETRGLANRSTPPAVFLHPDEAYASEYYGSGGRFGEKGATVAVDLSAMKRDGLTPQVGNEEPLSEAAQRDSVAWDIGLEDFHDESADYDGEDESTLIVYDGIPAKYIKVVEGG